MYTQDKMSRRRLLKAAGASATAVPASYLLSRQSHASGIDKNQTPTIIQTNNSSQLLNRDFYSERLELIRLLKEVTEVEHSLMLQYLYAGFSIKPTFRSLAGTGAPDSDSFIGIAVQEMQHLGKVNALLVELGAAPNLDVQDMPLELDIYPFAMELEPLSRSSVAKYTFCEAPPSAVKLTAGDVNNPNSFASSLHRSINTSPRINHVGSVYNQLISLLSSVKNSKHAPNIDYDYWVAELRHIMDEGEIDHYHFFKSIYTGEHVAFEKAPDWWNYPIKHDHFPAYDNGKNHTAYQGHANQISDPLSRKLAWLSNLHYWSVLVMLDYYYRTNHASLKNIAVMHMMLPLRSLGSELAKRGVGIPFDRLSLGYCPSHSLSENLSFVIQLQRESQQLREEIGDKMPEDYPVTAENSCISQLEQVLADTDQRPSLQKKRVSSIFSGYEKSSI